MQDKALRKKSKRLKYEDRLIIERMIKEGASAFDMSCAIGVHVATIYRDIERGGGVKEYSARKAQEAIG